MSKENKTEYLIYMSVFFLFCYLAEVYTTCSLYLTHDNTRPADPMTHVPAVEEE